MRGRLIFAGVQFIEFTHVSIAIEGSRAKMQLVAGKELKLKVCCDFKTKFEEILKRKKFLRKFKENMKIRKFERKSEKHKRFKCKRRKIPGKFWNVFKKIVEIFCNFIRF